MLELYWSGAQLAARQEPAVVAVLMARSRLYAARAGLNMSLEHVFTYGERLRIRRPADTIAQHRRHPHA